MDIERAKQQIKRCSLVNYGKEFDDCELNEKYMIVSKAVMEQIMPTWIESKKKFEKEKQAYYFSAEYLMGRALGNNLLNLGYKDEFNKLLEELGLNYEDIEEVEEDAALGNGGLGRLAACFLDSAATLNLPLSGYGIRYEFGLFKQDFINGFQDEKADNWLKYGDPWSIRKDSEAVKVHFSDGDIMAIPYDTPILGYRNNTVNTLRLWKAEAIEPFNFEDFNNQEYERALREKNSAENISKVLYPNDSNYEGKKLRLKQQYFFVAASLRDLIRKHKLGHKDFSNFPDLHAIQLNDTHPAVAIPELMRLLTEKEHIPWKEAWNICINTFAYTNHTLLAEALETWSVEIYKDLLPKVYTIIEKIDNQLREELKYMSLGEYKIEDYQIISGGQIKMAWLSIYGSKSTNGVAMLHSTILRKSELAQWDIIYPNRLNNKTNGITQRRWLLLSNPELSKYITKLLGTDKWAKDLSLLKSLEKYKDDEDVLNKFLDIKAKKKRQLAEYILEHEGIEIDPNSIYDIQIKRFHEYKRQLLNAFHILDLYHRLKENPDMDIVPRTFIFGGKAAPGYYRAKTVIKFINDIASLINNDEDIKGKIKLVFVRNYRVSYAQKLFPAADVSQQISTAGKEASGTGNMKFMLNGAPTLGTYDGANVEIVEEAGEENNFIFGLTVEEIEVMNNIYSPLEDYLTVPGLKKVVDTLIDGTFMGDASGDYRQLYESLINGNDWEKPDVYYLIKDFESYRDAQTKVDKAFRDRLTWAKMAWMNIANSGKFTSDRTIRQYAEDIWEIKSKED